MLLNPVHDFILYFYTVCLNLTQFSCDVTLWLTERFTKFLSIVCLHLKSEAALRNGISKRREQLTQPHSVTSQRREFSATSLWEPQDTNLKCYLHIRPSVSHGLLPYIYWLKLCMHFQFPEYAQFQCYYYMTLHYEAIVAQYSLCCSCPVSTRPHLLAGTQENVSTLNWRESYTKFNLIQSNCAKKGNTRSLANFTM
jgi:hypothetical protein